MRRMVLVLAAGLAVALPACGVNNNTTGDAVRGKQLFVQKCGACHQLRRAGTQGVTGPNLDAAFAQSRRDGIPTTAIRGVVKRQILYPMRGGAMPAKIVTGAAARDVATYVGDVAARGGQDEGLLATIGGAVKKQKAAARNGRLSIPADPNGQLAYLVSSASAPPGKLEIDSVNKASIPHDISLEGRGVKVSGRVVQNGGISKITVNVKPGRYTFYCSVTGHRQAGMVGPLTVG